MKAKNFKHPSRYILSYLLVDPCIEIWRFFLDFFRVLAIENLKKKNFLKF